MRPIESLKAKLARVKCKETGLAAGAAACTCRNCRAVRHMKVKDGIGKDIVVSEDGMFCLVTEASDM